MKILVNFFIMLYLVDVMAQSQIRQAAQPTSYSHMYFTSGHGPKLTKTATKVFHPNGGLQSLYQDFDQHQHRQQDMQPEESTRVQATPKFTTKQSYKQLYESEEDVSEEHYKSIEDYSDESPNSFHYKENDSRGYTIGTQIRVHHPDIPAPKKIFSDKAIKGKTNKFATYDDFSHEFHDLETPYVLPPSKKHKLSEFYKPEVIRVIAPPKVQAHPVHFTALSSNGGYNVYESDNEFLPSDDLKESLRQQFKTVASKKQIEKYLEDQEKMLDEALKWQILHNPKYKELAKLVEKEPYTKLGEKEFFGKASHYNHEIESHQRPPPHFHKKTPQPPFNNRSRRRPAGAFKHTAKPKIRPMLVKPNRKYRQAIVIEV